ncbi:MAG: DUF4249 domain-containing protein [Prolixibacteraceae bacterium]|nr:DUF4249 domain-containing protein [Prolixibacteraceae bacterium]
MTTKNSYWFVIIISYLLFSCEKEVTLDLNSQSKLTFNCILNPDSTIHATLTQSRELNAAGNFMTIEGAEIELFENTNFLGAMNDQGNGNYDFNYKPKPGQSYNVEIAKENYLTAKAQTIVPRGVKIEFVQKVKEPDEYNRLLTEIKINDIAGSNYYWYYTYSIDREMSYKYISSIYSLYSPYFDDFNKRMEPESRYGYYYNHMVRIKDDNNDGQILSWEIYKRINDRYEDYNIILETDQHYDKYLKSSVQMRMLEDETIPLNEPVQIYSNIENGYGIFGANIISVLR